MPQPRRIIRWSQPDIGREETRAVNRVLRSHWLSFGPETQRFEADLCAFTGARHAVVVNNGTSALVAALLAHRIGRGDEVLVPALTFVATVNAVLAVGAKPVLADVDPGTCNVTPETLRRALSRRARALIPVDVAGMPADIGALRSFSARHRLTLIEDAAEALGAEYRGRRVGGFPHTAVLSFHMAKLCTTVEGGAVLTPSPEVARRLRAIRNHGMEGTQRHVLFGLNLKPTDLQSAMGRAQLAKAGRFLRQRRRIAEIYLRGLKGLVEFQSVPPYVTRHPWMFFPIFVDAERRDRVAEALRRRGIEIRINWRAIPDQPYMDGAAPRGGFPAARRAASRTLSLPIGNGLPEKDAREVVRALREILGGNRMA